MDSSSTATVTAAPTPRTPPAHLLVRVAAQADCDVRSVRRYFRNEPLRPLVQERVRRAVRVLRARGRLPDDALHGQGAR